MSESAGLLETILADADLHGRLQDMPADLKTVTLVSPQNDFSHPDLITETVALDVPATQTGAVESNLPRRDVSALGNPNRPKHSDYRLIGELGRGGTGIVFQAHQPAVDREVAVKKLRSELATSEVARQRFLTEARVIGGLDHPNVIALHEVYVDDAGDLYYSMKRIDGSSWSEQIAAMSLDQNLDTLLRVADGIRYAHSRGLIHRDIKPENVMMGRFGEVLLADWGLAIHTNIRLDGDEKQSIGGTPAYMAPELASGFTEDVGKPSDIYLLGATLYQILTGHPPHTGETLVQCIQNAANNIIQPTEIDNELMSIAMMAMQTDPKNRYQSVDDFIAAINEHRDHEQSNRLVRRAIARVADVSTEGSSSDEWHQNFNIADALLMEAIDIWPENTKAICKRRDLQRQHANLARSRGDLDLAASIYESLGESDSEAAQRVSQEQQRILAQDVKASRYSTLFVKSPDPGLLIQMGTSRIVEANEAFGNLFGYARDQVLGQEIDRLNLWACPDCRSKFVEQLEDKRVVDDFEATLLHRDGKTIDTLINSRVASVDGEEMMVSTIRDVSLRVQAEQDLKRSREKLRDFQRLAGLATWSFNVAEGKVYWSSETFDLAGRDRKEGTPSREEYYESVHPDDRERLQAAVDRAIETGKPYEAIIRQRLAKGEYETVIVRGQAIFDDNGKTMEVYGVLIPQN